MVPKVYLEVSQSFLTWYFLGWGLECIILNGCGRNTWSNFLFFLWFLNITRSFIWNLLLDLYFEWLVFSWFIPLSLLSLYIDCLIFCSLNDCHGYYIQSVSINGFNSNISTITCGVSQGSVLGLLLFFIYINDLNLTIKHYKVYHFADGANLLNIVKSPKHLNKLINIDLQNLTKWLNANKISLNVSKTEMVLLRTKRKVWTSILKKK